MGEAKQSGQLSSTWIAGKDPLSRLHLPPGLGPTTLSLLCCRGGRAWFAFGALTAGEEHTAEGTLRREASSSGEFELFLPGGSVPMHVWCKDPCPGLSCHTPAHFFTCAVQKSVSVAADVVKEPTLAKVIACFSAALCHAVIPQSNCASGAELPDPRDPAHHLRAHRGRSAFLLPMVLTAGLSWAALARAGGSRAGARLRDVFWE